MHHTISAGRRAALQLGRIATMLTTTNAADSAQMEFSATCARFHVVSTAYQEHASAIAMSGTSATDTILATTLPVARAVSRSIKAHWPAKHNSARVATERPTMTLESQVSNRPRRGTS